MTEDDDVSQEGLVGSKEKIRQQFDSVQENKEFYFLSPQIIAKQL